MAESGQVISLDGDKAIVRMERTEACAKCRACMAGFSKQEMIIHAVNACDAKEGDIVNIELTESSFLKAVLIMYGIPFAAMIAGFLAGYFLADNLNMSIDSEIAGFAVGIIFMPIAYFLIKKHEGKWSEVKYTPVATRHTNGE